MADLNKQIRNNPFAPPTMQPNPLMPPMPPPPTGPEQGFQAFASDVRNNLKVQPAMTSPTAPLQPNAQPQGMSAIYNPPGAPKPLPTQEQDQAAHPDAYANPVMGSKVGKILTAIAATSLGAAGGMHGNPGAGAQYALGVKAADDKLGQENTDTYNSRIVQPRKDALAAANTQSEIDYRAAHAKSLTDAATPVTLTPEQAVSIGHPELAGMEMPSKLYATMLSGKQKVDSATSIAAGKNQTAKEIADGRNQRVKDTTDAANKTKLLLQDKRDATSAANTSARIAAKGTPGAAGAVKVPADITKRAALSSNVLENADAVESIIKRRPEIVGATGGRYSTVQQMIGSDDPDIQALGVRMHNIALASNGAHGLRSAEAVAQTENELFNHFKAGPNAIHGGLNAIRGSVQTFLDDEKNYQTSGSRTGVHPFTPPTQATAKSGAVEEYVRDPKTGKLVKK